MYITCRPNSKRHREGKSFIDGHTDVSTGIRKTCYEFASLYLGENILSGSYSL